MATQTAAAEKNGKAGQSKDDKAAEGKLKVKLMLEYREAVKAIEEAERIVQEKQEARNQVVKTWFEKFGQTAFRSSKDGKVYTPMKRSTPQGKKVSEAPEGHPLGKGTALDAEGKAVVFKDSYYFRTSGDEDIQVLDI